MKFALLAFALSLSLPAAHAAENSIFSKISDDAQTANGSTEIVHYDTKVKKEDLQAQGLKDLKKEYWKGCGPWKEVTGRREAIGQIEKLEKESEKTEVAADLRKLYDDDKIVAIAGAVSKPSVECSLSWYNIYGADGTLLKMRYNEGD